MHAVSRITDTGSGTTGTWLWASEMSIGIKPVATVVTVSSSSSSLSSWSFASKPSLKGKSCKTFSLPVPIHSGVSSVLVKYDSESYSSSSDDSKLSKKSSVNSYFESLVVGAARSDDSFFFQSDSIFIKTRSTSTIEDESSGSTHSSM